jgi:Secretion system C-terminal sorting domain
LAGNTAITLTVCMHATLRPQQVITGLLITALLLTTATTKGYAGMPHRDTITISKNRINKKYRVKLYPNASQEVIFFSASGTEGKNYQLFVFDLEGKLVKQTQIKNKQTTIISNIEKGDYLFEVFSDDERIENGNLSVR